MNSRDYRFLMQAQKLSLASGEHFKIGAIIVKGNRILGMGVNSRKSHPKAKGPFKSTHAEHQAILNAGLTDTEGAVCYVYRATKDGKSACSKPCKSCTDLLKNAGIKTVFSSKKELPFWEEERYN